jgi:N-acetylmuramoyl-L-alanine amidase
MRSTVPLLIGVALFLSGCADKHLERIIVVDPGHGGLDPGAIGSTSSTLEKEVALRAGLALRDQLEATGRYQVIMTRDDDWNVPLRDRVRIAHEAQGELFISLHADSLTSRPEVRGASVFILSEKAFGDELARWKENRSDILTGIDLAQRDANNHSITLAELLVQELNGATRLARRRPAQAGFVVLHSPNIPSVLIELGYLSNSADEEALADDAHIDRLANAVARAVDAYFGLGAV